MQLTYETQRRLQLTINFHRGFVLFLLITLLGILYTPPAWAQSAQSTTESTVIRRAPSQEEETFLACAARCGLGPRAEKVLVCFSGCQVEAKLSEGAVVRLVGPGFGRVIGGGTGIFGGGGFGFNCPEFERTCSCTSYFDCKTLERSGCCKGIVHTCTSTGGAQETCYCDKSRKCGG